MRLVTAMGLSATFAAVLLAAACSDPLDGSPAPGASIPAKPGGTTFAGGGGKGGAEQDVGTPSGQPDAAPDPDVGADGGSGADAVDIDIDIAVAPADAGEPPPDTGDVVAAPTCVDLDADGYGSGCEKGYDCDDGNPYLHTDCPDCSTTAAEGCPCGEPGQQTYCFAADAALAGVGQCKPGVRSCVDGYWGECAGEKLPKGELCDGLDNDCDGVPDNGLGGCQPPPCLDADGDDFGDGCLAGKDCDDANPHFAAECPDCSQIIVTGCPCTTPGAQTFCFSGDLLLVGKGVCAAGKRACSNGFWSECANEVLPTAEACDTLDNDCDGLVDEDVQGCAKPPSCVDADGDGYGKDCSPGPDCDDGNPAFTTECPDCTQAILTGCPCAVAGQAQTCYSGDPAMIGQGPCTAGQRTCVGNHWTACLGEVVATTEVCDGADNDCDGAQDEGVVGECGDCNVLCHVDEAGPASGAPFDPTPENASGGVVLTPEGWLTLSESSYNLHFIWIANSGESTVSKLDTVTGNELGRYHTCSDPSRTAVDSKGDAWVACRGNGNVMKIRNIVEKCADKNGNGVIETSMDSSGDGIIQAGEMLAKGQDECVLFEVNPGVDSLARALGVAYDGSAWVGYWNVSKLAQLDANNGSLMTVIDLGGVNPYGLAIDSKGIIWVAGRGGSKLLRVEPNTKKVTQLSPGGCFEPYGIGIDEWDRVWIGNCCCGPVGYVYDPSNGAWGSAPSESRPRGIVSNKDGFVFIANDESSRVTKVNAKTLQKVSSVYLGAGRFPVGIAVDPDGYVWAVNQSASSVTKIDPNTMTIVLEHPVGKSPYTYSDMTGSTFFKSVVPEGTYMMTFVAPPLDDYLNEWYDNVWDSLVIDAVTPPGTSVSVRVRAGATEPELAGAPWSASQGPYPPATFPLLLKPALGAAAAGTQILQVEITLTSSESLKPVVKGITVQYGAKPKL